MRVVCAGAGSGEYLLFSDEAGGLSDPLFMSREFRGLRSATQGSALRTRDLLKKVDQNFSATMCSWGLNKSAQNFIKPFI